MLKIMFTNIIFYLGFGTGTRLQLKKNISQLVLITYNYHLEDLFNLFWFTNTIKSFNTFLKIKIEQILKI